MQTEFEVKIFDVDVASIQKKLDELSIKSPESIVYKRYIYNLPYKNGSWIRLRTDGKTSTLTQKEYLKDSIDGVRELEIIVDDFAKTNEFLELNFGEPKAYQENTRKIYYLDNAILTIDLLKARTLF